MFGIFFVSNNRGQSNPQSQNQMAALCQGQDPYMEGYAVSYRQCDIHLFWQLHLVKFGYLLYEFVCLLFSALLVQPAWRLWQHTEDELVRQTQS